MRTWFHFGLIFPFLEYLGAVLGASWGRLWDVQGRLGAFAGGLNFLNDFGIDFLTILASIWEPSGVRLGPRWRLKSAKNLTGGLPERVLEPNMYPNAFMKASATIFDRCLKGF